MDASILATLFCFFTLVIIYIMLGTLNELKKRQQHSHDLTVSISENVRTVRSIVEQIEGKLEMLLSTATTTSRNPIITEPYPLHLSDTVVWVKQNPGETFPEAAKRAMNESTVKPPTENPHGVTIVPLKQKKRRPHKKASK